MRDWNKLRTFYYVARTGSFSKTGLHLNLSQPAISRQVIELEKQIGHKLFLRKNKGVELTKQGSLLLEAAEHMQGVVERAKNKIDEEYSVAKGQLTVDAVVGFSYLYLYPELHRFLKKYPEIQLCLNACDTIPILENGYTDVFIHPYIENQPHLIQHFLKSYHLKLYASSKYLEQHGEIKTLDDLNNHRLISFGAPSYPYDASNWLLRVGMPEGEIRTPYAQLNATQGRFELAKQGVGIVSLPQEHPGIGKSGLVEVLPEIEGPTLEIFVIYSEEIKDVKKIQVFEEFLHSLYPQEL
jgi:DNA-binding transcriptional LysR family regulator